MYTFSNQPPTHHPPTFQLVQLVGTTTPPPLKKPFNISTFAFLEQELRVKVNILKEIMKDCSFECNTCICVCFDFSRSL